MRGRVHGGYNIDVGGGGSRGEIGGTGWGSG